MSYLENTISKFDDGYSIEMYIESVDGFQGDGDFMSKFGLEIRDSCSLIVSKKDSKIRWEVIDQRRRSYFSTDQRSIRDQVRGTRKSILSGG